MKSTLSTRVDDDLLARARAAVQGVQRVDPNYTLARLVCDAIDTEVRRLETAHSGGKPFPPAATLRPGPRIGTTEEVR